MSAMSKRGSVVEPSSQETIPEANEQPTPRRSQSSPLKSLRTEASTQSSKSSGPPSPPRQRTSTAISNPRVPQQSLDAAAQMLASRPSNVGRRSTSANQPPVPGPVHHQIGRTSSSSPMTERRPRLTTEIPASATAANGNTSLAVSPPPRRTATAPALPVERRTRPRRHTNASTKDISSPILDHGQPTFLLRCWPVFLILKH